MRKAGFSVGAEIYRRRKALKLTQEKLAELVGYDSGGISRVENGKQGLSENQLRKFAEALGCAAADLFAGDAWRNVNSVPIGSRRIPLISYVQAGRWMEVAHDESFAGEDWILTDRKVSQAAFALAIRGDSMLPDYREGDTVIIDPADTPRPGDFVVANSGEEDATFKKYRPRGINENGEKVFELVPLNEDYETLRSDITPIQIIGTMVEHRRYRKR